MPLTEDKAEAPPQLRAEPAKKAGRVSDDATPNRGVERAGHGEMGECRRASLGESLDEPAR